MEYSKELEKMKSCAFLINTSRGGIVDENALHKALISDRLAGAAMDRMLSGFGQK